MGVHASGHSVRRLARATQTDDLDLDAGRV
jgi:hypothetical protein